MVPLDAPFVAVPRSREVGQPYLTALFTTLWAFFACIRVVFAARPDLLLVNGPGTCLPLCVAAWLLRSLAGVPTCGLLFPATTKIVFVESVCRVKGLSLTGKILYHLRIADAVHVQWAELKERHPRAEYVGVLL